jgi:hypothetical protein
MQPAQQEQQVQVPVFGDEETITISELRVGDFVTVVPTQSGIRGVRFNSAVKEADIVYGRWTKSNGYRQRRTPVESKRIAFRDAKTGAYNYPLTFEVKVRRPVR